MKEKLDIDEPRQTVHITLKKKGEFSVRAIFLNFLTFQRRIAEWSKALTTFTIAQMAMDRFPSMSHFLGGHFLTLFWLF